MNKEIFESEAAHLQLTQKRLLDCIQELQDEDATLSEALKAANLYLKDEMGSAPGDFLQAVEFSQTLQVEKQLLEQRGYQDQRYIRYKRLLPKPYFARIDFHESGESTSEVLYIGYGNFMDDKTLEIYIYDWRTPVASVFYDFQTGPVRYVAPDGQITGVVSIKRQFDIKNRTLIAYHDTQAHIADDKLLEALATRTSGPMHQIVETIQAEQNSIIREKKAEALFVEGIAGSGKTVVALHRIAYLLYHGLKNSLTSAQVMILSPNDLFSDYISHVIPELGEEQVVTHTLMDMIEKVMSTELTPSTIPFENPYISLERDLTEGFTQEERQGIRLKQDPRMRDLLSLWVDQFRLKSMPYQDFSYGEIRLTTAAAMRTALKDDGRNRPLMKRLGRFTQRVRQRVKDHEKAYYAQVLLETMVSGEHPFDYKAAARLKRYKTYRHLSRALTAVESISALEVYRALLEQPQFLKKVFTEWTPSDCKTLCEATLKSMERGTLSVDDWVLVAYLHQLMHGDHGLSNMRQVVVDESQDYSPMAFALMRTLFDKAHFTILGDHHQTLQDTRESSHHQIVAQVLGFEEPVFRSLTVAYRNSMAIGKLCLDLFAKEAAKEGYGMVEREGEAPQFFYGEDAISLAIDHMLTGKHGTIAVITKSMARARQVHEHLLLKGPFAQGISLLDLDAQTLPQGILVMPVYLAKGMEFDGVVIADADTHTYHTERDRQLLYVCASRALHSLCITSSYAKEEGRSILSDCDC